jgi:hypothetical protein
MPEETCFQQVRLSAVEGTSQAVLGSYDQRKVPASISLFLKSEKIPALLYVLLYVGKGPEYSPFRDFDLFLRRIGWGTDLNSRKGLYSHIYTSELSLIYSQ